MSGQAAVDPVSCFIPFGRIDVGRREVWAVATSEELVRRASAGNGVITFEASKRGFERMQQEALAMGAPGGIVRDRWHDTGEEVGRAIAWSADEDERVCRVGMHISEGAENTWQKILDGTYAGVSVGGAALERSPQIWRTPDGNETATQVITDVVYNEIVLTGQPSDPKAVIEKIYRSAEGISDVVGSGEGLDVARVFSPQARAARAAKQHANAKGPQDKSSTGTKGGGKGAKFGDSKNFTVKVGDKYVAYVGGKKLGEFDSQSEAEQAYNKAGGPGTKGSGAASKSKTDSKPATSNQREDRAGGATSSKAATPNQREDRVQRAASTEIRKAAAMETTAEANKVARTVTPEMRAELAQKLPGADVERMRDDEFLGSYDVLVARTTDSLSTAEVPPVAENEDTEAIARAEAEAATAAEEAAEADRIARAAIEEAAAAQAAADANAAAEDLVRRDAMAELVIEGADGGGMGGGSAEEEMSDAEMAVQAIRIVEKLIARESAEMAGGDPSDAEDVQALLWVLQELKHFAKGELIESMDMKRTIDDLAAKVKAFSALAASAIQRSSEALTRVDEVEQNAGKVERSAVPTLEEFEKLKADVKRIEDTPVLGPKTTGVKTQEKRFVGDDEPPVNDADLVSRVAWDEAYAAATPQQRVVMENNRGLAALKYAHANPQHELPSLIRH